MVSSISNHHCYGPSLPATRCGITSWFTNVSSNVPYTGNCAFPTPSYRFYLSDVFCMGQCFFLKTYCLWLYSFRFFGKVLESIKWNLNKIFPNGSGWSCLAFWYFTPWGLWSSGYSLTWTLIFPNVFMSTGYDSGKFTQVPQARVAWPWSLTADVQLKYYWWNQSQDPPIGVTHPLGNLLQRLKVKVLKQPFYHREGIVFLTGIEPFKQMIPRKHVRLIPIAHW